MLTWALAALAAPLVLLILHDMARRPLVRRLAVRNLARRRGEAALIIAGSLLGTAIVTASFVVGDTLRASVRDAARTELGPVDEVVTVTGLSGLSSADAAVRRGVPGTDGVLTAISAPASLQRPGPDPRALPSVTLLEVDFDEARAFGGDPAATGLAGAGVTPAGNDVVIPEDAARALGVRPGDRVELFSFGAQRSLTVRDVVPRIGLAGYGRPSAFVAPGTIAALAPPLFQGAGTIPPVGLVMVSNEGGVYDGAKGTGAVMAVLEDRIGAMPNTEVRAVKRDLLERADADARQFVQLFGGIGAFSVTAGVLLLVNIFVMLADERKAELGMLRAVGLKRNQLVRAFGAEGGIYSLLAALAGALAGVGVGRVVVVAAEGIFGPDQGETVSTALQFTARPTSVLSGFVIGGTIALLTVWVASVRIGGMNVIRAIRDLPDGQAGKRRPRALALSALGVAAGGGLLAAGLNYQNWFGTLVGVPLAAASAVPLMSRVVSRRAAVTWLGGLVILWATGCFSVFPRSFDGGNIPTFVVQGIILVAAAIAIGATNADVVGRAIARAAGTRGNLAARLAFAYPVARRFRTSMLLGIYALILFVLTFLAVFSHMFGKQVPRFTRESSAGFDLILDSNASNPATINTLFAQDAIDRVAPIVRGTVRFSSPTRPTLTPWTFSGFDRSFIQEGHPVLSGRMGRFGSDAEVWEAVVEASDLVVVASSFLQEGGGPPQSLVRAGDVIEAFNPSTNDTRQLTVAGVLASDWLDQGVVASAALAREFLGAASVSNRHYVAVDEGVDPSEAARSLTGNLVQFGTDAATVSSLISAQLSQQQGFLRLMQGYLVLGLLVGVAGLGVVMVRAVRERRRHIGMLRALGLTSATVRRAFLLEAGFVAVQGTLVGLVLALVVSFQLLTNSDLFGQTELDYGVPVLSLVVLAVMALGASLAATAVPATQAARIRPAVALRIAD
ncbi:MAG: FtsX-like permease family protein [Actinomycetota bacterium]